MRRKVRPIVITLASLFAAPVLLCLAGLYYLQTTSFKHWVQQEVVSTLEQASGGRVRLGSFDFDWRTFTARLRNLEIRGTEPAASPALLRVASVRVRFQLLSFLERTVAIADIAAERPAVYLLIRTDGSTNIPRLRGRFEHAVKELFSLKVKRFNLNGGFIQINEDRYPVTVEGRDVDASLKYQPVQSIYDLSFSTRQVLLHSACCPELPLDFAAKATLHSNALAISGMTLRSGNSTLQVSGQLSPLTQPVATFRFRGEIEKDDILLLPAHRTLRPSEVIFEGTAGYARESGFSADGLVRAHRVAASLAKLNISNGDFSAGFHFSNEALELRNVAATLLGGTFKGSAVLKQNREWEIVGRLASISLTEAAASSGIGALRWSGFAGGEIRGTSGSGWKGQLAISPGQGVHPLQGEIKFSAANGADLHFDDSQLDAPHTQLAFRGDRLGGFHIVLNSNDLADIAPVLAYLNGGFDFGIVPMLLPGGSAVFNGTVKQAGAKPLFSGTLSLARFKFQERAWDQFRWKGTMSPDALDADTFSLGAGSLHASGVGSLQLHEWKFSSEDVFRFKGNIEGVALDDRKPGQDGGWKLPVSKGMFSATLDVSGSLQEPSGTARIHASELEMYDQKLDRLEVAVSLAGDELRIEQGKAEDAQGSTVQFRGTYTHDPRDWRNGNVSANLESDRIILSRVPGIEELESDLRAQLAVHTQIAARVKDGEFLLQRADGKLALRSVSKSGENLGALNAQFTTQNRFMRLELKGALRGSNFSGKAGVHLTPDYPLEGDVQFDRIELIMLRPLLFPALIQSGAVRGFLKGSVAFSGPVFDRAGWRSAIRIEQLQLTPAAYPASAFALHNARPILLDLANGVASVRDLELLGQDTRVSVNGSVGYLQKKPINLAVDGSISLQAFKLLKPDIATSGAAIVKASVAGTLAAPSLSGRLDLRGGAISSQDLPNGLSNWNGSITFDRNRATIESMTAESGGGQLTVGGFVSFGGTTPFGYHLVARAEDTRVRSPGGISITANADVRLTGTSGSGLLSGRASVSRVVFNPNTDIGNVLTNFAAPVPAPANQKGFLSGLQLDLSIENAPNLQLSTSLSRDVEAEIDLRLRGTPDRPVLLGTVSANQGDIRVFGTRYSINRGEISFVNASRVDPVLDLDLQTQARGINVDISIAGTLNRLNISYRSDPPLQPRDIIALLAVGRSPQDPLNSQITQNTTDTIALQSGANSVLGQAVAPSSSRLSKLFGITNIKIDPLVQGITNIRQSRLTLEQQISRAITITYVTNLEQTSEQIFRLEWSINRQYSVVAVRDDNGEFGIDIQYKRRFK